MNPRSDHIVLIGMMACGKTTIGRRLAKRLGRPFVDIDEVIERTADAKIAEIFTRDGEGAFRALERAALADACDATPPAVIAVGGGAVLDEENRTRLSRSGRIIFLEAKPETLVGRIADPTSRPLLGADAPGALARLVPERGAIYRALGEITVHVDQKSPDAVTNEVLAALRERVTFDLGERSYDVVVGPGATELLASVLPEQARRAVVVTQASIPYSIECPIPFETYVIEEGEQAKSLRTIESLCRFFAQHGLTRNDAIIAVGGGVVTDAAGFAASCYHRGANLVNVATTLLGQIDAAFGGKTGVNLPEGKNLVGAFYQPAGVICDTDMLASLPEREWRSGLGEMAKYAFLGIEDLDELSLVEQVARCVELKAEVTTKDERETGRRVILNYGHTLAHALEALGFAEADHDSARADLRHGEAVGVGLVFAARLAERLGRIDAARVERHVDVLAHYGISTAMPDGVDLDEIIAFMERDKKATAGLTFVLDGPLGVELVAGVDRTLVRDVLAHSLSGV